MDIERIFVRGKHGERVHHEERERMSKGWWRVREI
jgi:hypothetical protein